MINLSSNKQDYFTHWLISGPKVVPYDGAPGDEDKLRISSLDKCKIKVPDNIRMGGKSPLGDTWHYFWPGENSFIEKSSFYYNISLIDFYAATELISSEDFSLPLKLWASRKADVYLNGEHVLQQQSSSHRYPEMANLKLDLKKGKNQIFIRLQVLGIRDTRHLFGMQLQDPKDKSRLKIIIPGMEEKRIDIEKITNWLNELRFDDNLILRSTLPPPVKVKCKLLEETVSWQDGETGLALAGAKFEKEHGLPFVEIRIDNNDVDISKLLIAPDKLFQDESNKKREFTGGLDYFNEVYNTSEFFKSRTLPNLMIRHLFGDRDDLDTEEIIQVCEHIDKRPDCADFSLALLLRLYQWETTTQEEKDRIKSTVLNFRYWTDEPGNDAMCFESENHSLIFHGCQRIAGMLFPKEKFVNSGRVGSELEKLGLERIRAWFKAISPVGFSEYLSTTYMPITLAALLNIYDYVEDDSLVESARLLLDRLIQTLAKHTFDGVTTGPQGRVYRDVLLPETGGTQAIISYCTVNSCFAFHGWLVCLASSKYEVPDNIDKLTTDFQEISYREGNAYISLKKTDGYCLSSVQLPNAVIPKKESHDLWPESQGYQQHIAHATLGKGCHIFTSHPGCFNDASSSRPGYWYGNGSIPYQYQDGNKIYQIFNIPNTDFIDFTHLYWPSGIFDEQIIEEQWIVGSKNHGCIAIWCSSKLRPHNDMLFDSEFRAVGRQVAWVWFCGSLSDYSENGGLKQFLEDCRAQNPDFSKKELQISLEGKIVLKK